MANTQTMYLDGVKVGDLTGQPIEHSLLTFNQVGLASATTPASWPGWGSTAQRYFAGTIDEVAVYSRPSARPRPRRTSSTRSRPPSS